MTTSHCSPQELNPPALIATAHCMLNFVLWEDAVYVSRPMVKENLQTIVALLPGLTCLLILFNSKPKTVVQGLDMQRDSGVHRLHPGSHCHCPLHFWPFSCSVCSQKETMPNYRCLSVAFTNCRQANSWTIYHAKISDVTSALSYVTPIVQSCYNCSVGLKRSASRNP